MSEFKENSGALNSSGDNNILPDVDGPAGKDLLAELDHEYGRPAPSAGSAEAAGDAPATAAEAADDAAVVEAAGDAAATTAEPVNDTATTAAENADDAAATAAETADDAAVAEAAGDAAATATETADDAAVTVTETADDAAIAATGTAGAAEAVAAEGPADTAIEIAANAGAAGPAAAPPAPPVPEKRTPTWIKLLRTTLLLGAIIGLFIFYYVTQSYQYTDKFMKGTYINGSDVSDKTVEEIEENIRARVEDMYSLTLTFRDGTTETITPEEIGYRYVSSGDVQEAMDAQNPMTWVLRNMGQTAEITVPENHTYDEKKLEAVVKAMPEFQVENIVTPTNAYLNITDANAFEIVPETQGNAPIADAVLPALNELVTNAEMEADLSKIAGSYETPVVTADNPDLVYQLDNLNKFLSTTITYKLPNNETQTIDRGLLINWVTRQDNGYYYLDDAAIRENCSKYVADIAAKVDERHTSIPFQSTSQGTINLSCSEYGRVIDQPGETEALFTALYENKSEEKEPLYSLNKSVDPTFGGTYVEADLTNQRVLLYVNGQVVVDTPCVSGTKYDSSRHTVRGLYSIYYKQRNRTLQGPMVNGVPSYTSFVNYWMPFYQGYGLHDAPWRGSFGGTIYYSSGSHGCINLPYSAAQTMYSYTEVGTPVIVFGGY